MGQAGSAAWRHTAVAAVGIGRAKHGTACDAGVGTCGHDAPDVVCLHAAIHFQPDRLATGSLVGVDLLAGRRQLGQGCFDELLPAKAGVHTHQQHDVQPVHHMVHPVE